MKKKFIILLLFIMFLFPFKLMKTQAAQSSCYYDLCGSGFTINYDTNTGKISSYNNLGGTCSVDLSMVSANVFINNGKLVCPKLYYKYEGSGRTAYYTFSSSEVKTWYTLNYNSSKSTLPDVELSTIKTCEIKSGSYSVSVTVDTSEQVVKGISLPGFKTVGSIKYNEIISNGECKPNVKVYVKCDDRGSKICNVSTSYLPGSTQATTPQPDDSLENGTGSENDDVINGDKVYGCQVIPEEIKEWINRALNLVKYVALVLVIILGVLDFIKAAASGEAEDMKKSGQSFLKRVIAVIILFLLPVIVELILNLVEIYGADSTCIQ